LREVLENAGADGNFESLIYSRGVSKESTSRGRGQGKGGKEDCAQLPLWQRASTQAKPESEAAIEAAKENRALQAVAVCTTLLNLNLLFFCWFVMD
jgi:hypothetical protein